jgi:DNA modification methylase
MTSTPSSSPTVRARTRGNAPPDGGISALGLDKALALKVTERPLSELKPSARNARTHSKKQINQVADSIRVFRFVNPILVDGGNEIVAGHGRYAAAKLLGMSTVPVICLDHLTPDEIRAYRIADNRLAELAGWDDDLLKLELGQLLDINFEVELTGFDTPHVEFLLSDEHAVQKADPADEVAPVTEQAVTQLGDLWLLDEHRVFCGDARERASYEKLMGGALAQMTFTDPPYNVAIDGHVGGLGKIKHRPFAMASGEMSKAQFTAFLKGVFGEIKNASQDGALIYTCMDGQHLHEILTAGQEVFDELKTVITWAKTNAGMGSLYRGQTEFIPLWKAGKAAHINNIELGRHGRYRTTLWTYAGANGFRRGRMEDLASHPTVKPCAMVMDAIKDCSKPKGVILDAFGGSGTTLIAAAKTKRRGYLLELDALYVDVAVKRWQTLFNCEARHAETGLSFAEMALLRDQAVAGATQNMGGHDVA